MGPRRPHRPGCCGCSCCLHCAPRCLPQRLRCCPSCCEGCRAVEVKSVPAVAPVTYTVPQVYTHAVSSVGVPASTELLTKTVVAAPAVQYVANYAPLTHFVSDIPVAAAPAPAAAAPVAEDCWSR